MNEVCLCATPAALLCPEHEQDGPELRGRAYETLAIMYLNAYKFSELRARDATRLNFLQERQRYWQADKNRIAFAYDEHLSLREGIDAVIAEDNA